LSLRSKVYNHFLTLWNGKSINGSKNILLTDSEPRLSRNSSFRYSESVYFRPLNIRNENISHYSLFIITQINYIIII
jgi:hypothetical protein